MERKQAKILMQVNVNEEALKTFNAAMTYYSNSIHFAFRDGGPLPRTKRLRNCKAEVIITDAYYILKSYSTYVAVIDRINGQEVDVLRHEYGYTAASAQHISKFFHDYGFLGSRLVYRPV